MWRSPIHCKVPYILAVANPLVLLSPECLTHTCVFLLFKPCAYLCRVSGTNHEHDQPAHLKIKTDKKNVPEEISLQQFAAPESRFCPAKVSNTAVAVVLTVAIVAPIVTAVIAIVAIAVAVVATSVIAVVAVAAVYMAIHTPHGCKKQLLAVSFVFLLLILSVSFSKRCMNTLRERMESRDCKSMRKTACTARLVR